jgi:hypothetical protein
VVLGGTGASGWITDFGRFAVILSESCLLRYLTEVGVKPLLQAWGYKPTVLFLLCSWFRYLKSG